MNPQLLYQEDSTQLTFEATVEQVLNLPDGRTGIVLDRTYFYPTGGGQEHDTGFLGAAQVIDVYKEGEPPQLVHVVDRLISPGPVAARIDGERRQRHMQNHTAQHLLTQCFLRLFGLETISANINGYSPSTLDLPLTALEKKDLDRAEDLANQIIYEDRPVKSYIVSPDELSSIPIRKQPKVSENIRIIEIDGYDYTPCGGTHVQTTGAIGVLKVLKTERQNDKTRVSFIAGWQALEYFRQAHEILTGLAGQLSVAPRDLEAVVERQGEQLRSAQKAIQGWQTERIAWEARQLADQSEVLGQRRIILADFEGRPAGELRLLGDQLRKMKGIVAVLASREDQKFSLVVACSPDSAANARDLLARLIVSGGGRGGGDASLAQGGGPLSAGQPFQAASPETRAALHALLEG